MRVLGTAGNTTLQTIVSTVKNGITKPYGNPLTLSITVGAILGTLGVYTDFGAQCAGNG
jgi:hypothetical protein